MQFDFLENIPASSGKIVPAVCILHDFHAMSWTSEGYSKIGIGLWNFRQSFPRRSLWRKPIIN